mgnify:CR=1 FL=1
MEVAIGLGIMLSEITNPAFRDTVITFESNPRVYSLKKCKNIADVIVAKQRHGPIGTIKTHFDSNYTRFSNMNIKDYDNIME